LARISRLPPGFFGLPLGLTGLALAYAKAGELDLLDPLFGQILTLVAAMGFSLVAAALGAKALLTPAAALQDMHDPNRLAMYGAGAMSLMGIGAQIAVKSLALGHFFWLIGCAADAFVCMLFYWRLLAGRWTFASAGPIWLIAAVGPISAPSGGILFGEDLISTMMFGTGIMGLLIVVPVLVVRVAFHDRPPIGPVTVIFLTPPALGTINVIAQNGGVDHAAVGVYGAGLIILGALVVQAPKIYRAPRTLSIWALVFPVSNYAIASELIGTAMDSNALINFGLGLMILASAFATTALVWTLTVLFRQGFLPDGTPIHSTP
jgi:tellurite resistance protein